MNVRTLGLLMALIVFFFCSAAEAMSRQIIAKTEAGLAKGYVTEDGAVFYWLGIPYAAPPTGDLRWKRPAPHPGWEGARPADEYGEKCVQLSALGGKGLKMHGSEDCLFLNVWRPAKSGKFPVMVWIHGGSLMMGGSDSPLYVGERFAREHDVVVVSFNYRLGVLGFLAHPDLQKEDPDASVGGYGMMDQIAALEWVQNNIESFGGDPSNVTIFGESAGGWSVCALMASPAAKGLFHRAIQESGGCRRSVTLDQGFDFGNSFAKELGCDAGNVAECMREVPASRVMKLAPWDPTGRTVPFKPNEDGYLLKKKPIDHVRSGDYNHVPYMAGSNRDEYKILALVQWDVRTMDREAYEKKIREEHGQWADRFLALYDPSDFDSPSEAYLAKEADGRPGCGGLDAVMAMSAHQQEVYYYRFDFDDIPFSKKLGAFHGLEIPLVFGTYQDPPVKSILGKKNVAAAAPLSGKMQAYWANFAKTGNPNGEDLPEWPAFEGEQRQRIVFDSSRTEVITQPEIQLERCRLWEEFSAGD